MDKELKFAISCLMGNMAFSIYHLAFGIFAKSLWMLTLGVYYLILSIVRFFVLRTKKKPNRATHFTGIMLIILSIPLLGSTILSVIRDRGYSLHMIIMIAMAAYAFTKITIATVNLIKSRHGTDAKYIMLRNISFADALVSIFALQRSMLVSFEGMNEVEIQIMNACLGCGVCIMVFLLGLNLIKSNRTANLK